MHSIILLPIEVYRFEFSDSYHADSALSLALLRLLCVLSAANDFWYLFLNLPQLLLCAYHHQGRPEATLYQ